MLTCSCDGDYERYYYPPKDFSEFTKRRRKRCCSCNRLIDIGSQCVIFNLYMYSDKIGDEIALSPNFMCEECGEIYFNLSDAGYCIRIDENMNELLAEYWSMVGFKKDEVKG